MTSNPQSLHIKSGQSPSWPSGQGGCTNSRLPWQCAQTSTRGITIVDIETTSTWHGATRVRQFGDCDTPCRRRLGHIGRLTRLSRSRSVHVTSFVTRFGMRPTES